VSSPQQQPDKPLTPREAWQPFTPRGIAAFADASLTRVMLAQLAVALIVAASAIWFLRIAWFPVVTEAIQQLPATGVIRQGALNFGGESPATLAENLQIAFVVDLSRSDSAGHAADIQVTFETNRLTLCGALGCWWKPYPPGYQISFNRPELEPIWGAWRGPMLAIVAFGTVACLYVMWWAVALFYVPLIKFIAFFADRVVTWRGAWRLGAAALLPGALIVALALVLYGFGVVDLFHFGLLYALHLLCGLLFVVTSPFFLPKLSSIPTAKNPFGVPKAK
jgi:hypothetical protein